MGKSYDEHKARDWVHEVITCNDDFTDNKSNIKDLFWPRRPLAIFAQEAKNTDYRTWIKNHEKVGVVQFKFSNAVQGSAVIWDREQAHSYGDAVGPFPAIPGCGYWNLVPNSGRGMLDRYAVWRDVEVGERGSGRIVRLMSAHRPPPRKSGTWDQFDERLDWLIGVSPFPVILGADINTKSLWKWPNKITNGRWNARGGHVDSVTAFGKGDEVSLVASEKRLPKGSSDHHPRAALAWIGRGDRTPTQDPEPDPQPESESAETETESCCDCTSGA